MLSVRRAPRSRVAVPSALGSLESVVALALAHLVAGGAVPPAWWLAAFGVLAYGASVPVLRRRASIRVVLPVLVATQVLGHAWLVALAPGAHAGHGPTGAEGAVLGLTVPMVLGHLAAAVVTAIMWSLRRRAVEVLLQWTATATIVSTRPMVAIRATVGHARRAAVWAIAPTRGPPADVAATT